MVGFVVGATAVFGGCNSAGTAEKVRTATPETSKLDEARDPVTGRTASQVIDHARERAAFLEQTCQKLYGAGWTYGSAAVKNYSASEWADVCWTPVDEGKARDRAEAPALQAARDAADAKVRATRIAQERAACTKQPGMAWLPDVSTPEGVCVNPANLGSAERGRAVKP